MTNTTNTTNVTATKLWKRNAVVAVVLLFICVGVYLNWSYHKEPEASAVSGETELADTLDTALLQEAGADTDTETAGEGGGIASVLPSPAAGFYSSARLNLCTIRSGQ